MSDEFEKLKREALRSIDSTSYKGKSKVASAPKITNISSPEKNDSKTGLFVSIGMVVVFIIGALFYVKSLPLYSIYKFRSAIANHDAASAMKYFDVDSIVDNSMKDVFTDPDGSPISKGFAMMMLPAVKEQAKSLLKTAIETQQDSEKTKVGPLWSGDLRNFDVTTEGKTAIVSLKDNDSIQFKMAKVPDGYWKVVAVIDADKVGERGAAKAYIELLSQALDHYRLDNGSHPTTEQGLQALTTNPGLSTWYGPYLARWHNDPWNRPFIYKCPGDHGAYDLYSLGADGLPGGRGKDKDITNW